MHKVSMLDEIDFGDNFNFTVEEGSNSKRKGSIRKEPKAIEKKGHITSEKKTMDVALPLSAFSEDVNKQADRKIEERLNRIKSLITNVPNKVVYELNKYIKENHPDGEKVVSRSQIIEELTTVQTILSKTPTSYKKKRKPKKDLLPDIQEIYKEAQRFLEVAANKLEFASEMALAYKKNYSVDHEKIMAFTQSTININKIQKRLSKLMKANQKKLDRVDTLELATIAIAFG